MQKIVSPLNSQGANQQLFDKINEFAAHIENKTEDLFEIDKEIDVVNKHSILNDEGKSNLNSFMIQKEKEKLSIIPMNPVKLIQNSSYHDNNADEEKMYPLDSLEEDDYSNYYYQDDYSQDQDMEEPTEVIQETKKF